MKTLIFGVLWLSLVAFATPASGNHDQGRGKSQDHLNGTPADVPVAQVPQPSSLVTFAVGGAVLAATLLRRNTGKARRG